MWEQFESPIEVYLYDALRGLGYRPLCQYPVGFGYRLDLAIFSKGEHFAIECDGKAYHTSPKQKAHDQKRDAYLKRLGWHVLRFSGSVIVADPMDCAYQIHTYIKKVTHNKCVRSPVSSVVESFNNRID